MTRRVIYVDVCDKCGKDTDEKPEVLALGGRKRRIQLCESDRIVLLSRLDSWFELGEPVEKAHKPMKKTPAPGRQQSTLDKIAERSPSVAPPEPSQMSLAFVEAALPVKAAKRTRKAVTK